MMRRNNLTGINCYPNDIIIEILARVPAVPDLYRCNQVCKLWLRLISSSEFIRTQKDTVKKFYLIGVEPCVVINPQEAAATPPHAVKHPPLVWMNRNERDDDGSIASSLFRWEQHLYGNIQWEKHIGGDIQILGSCDGVICFRIRCDMNGVVLFNPTTWKSNYIRINLLTGISFSWFGGYTLVLGHHFGCGFHGCIVIHSVYHPEQSKSRSCKLALSYPETYDGVGTFLNHTLYWPGDCGILSYSLRENMVFQIPVPYTVWRKQMRVTLGVLDSCLCAFHLAQEEGPSLVMWMRKESSWIKCRRIDGDHIRRIMNRYVVTVERYTLEDDEGRVMITRKLDRPKLIIMYGGSTWDGYRHIDFVMTLVPPNITKYNSKETMRLSW